MKYESKGMTHPAVISEDFELKIDLQSARLSEVKFG